MPASASFSELYQLDVRLCQPFTDAVFDVLKTQYALTITAGKPSFKDPQETESTDLAICVGISTDEMVGTLAICFTESMFLTMISKDMGETLHSLTPAIEHGALEFMNIVFNRAKRALVQKGMQGLRSVPHIVFGKQVRLRYLTMGQTILLPFSTEIGSFSLEITSQPISNTNRIGAKKEKAG